MDILNHVGNVQVEACITDIPIQQQTEQQLLTQNYCRLSAICNALSRQYRFYRD